MTHLLMCALCGPQYGDIILTEDGAGRRDFFRLPGSGVTANCFDSNPAGQTCHDESHTALPVLAITVTHVCYRSALGGSTVCLCLICGFLLLSGAVTMAAAFLHCLFTAFLKDQTSRCVRSFVLVQDCTALEALDFRTYSSFRVFSVSRHSYRITETLVSSLLCLHYCGFFSLVKYTVRYGAAGKIVGVLASLVLGAVHTATLPIQQLFQIVFVQVDTLLPFRGNPGYVVGLPLVAGWRTAEYPFPKITNDCLLGSPHVKGQSFPDYVASFGNSLPQNPMDWVPIENQTTLTVNSLLISPLPKKIHIRWTKYGTLVNAQAQIVSSSVSSITSSVSFIDVSAGASPGVRVPPTIDAKLPYDFFFPFV
uniref:Uncharacterized protein n=1 Tax=Electrophorus electricus TaxID=8005 RepID=A0A4W4HJR0_ELEEL